MSGRIPRAAAALAVFLGLAACGNYYEGPVSDNFDGERFRNPVPPVDRGFGAFWRWRFTREAPEWPEALPTPPPAKPADRVEGPALRVTMVGHASVLLQTNGLNILTDPQYSERASPVSFAGPKRRRPPGVAFDDLPKIDVVLVSHNHYDHLDLATLERLWQRDRPMIVLPLGNDAILADAIDGIETTALDWDQSVAVGNRARVIAVPVQHWSQRTLFDRNKALWAGFVIDVPGGPVFFAGDTGYGEWWIERVRAAAPGLRLALIPIGAYKPRWFMKYAHLDPEEAVRTFQGLGAAAALGIHWGTFPVADDAPDDALTELEAAREKLAVSAETFRTLLPGEVWRLEPNPSVSAPVSSGR